jgi:hypothetical protein
MLITVDSRRALGSIRNVILNPMIEAIGLQSQAVSMPFFSFSLPSFSRNRSPPKTQVRSLAEIFARNATYLNGRKRAQTHLWSRRRER